MKETQGGLLFVPLSLLLFLPLLLVALLGLIFLFIIRNRINLHVHELGHKMDIHVQML